MSVLIQDGRRSAHLAWTLAAVTSGSAHGVIISPFHTPRVGVRYHRGAATVAEQIGDIGGEVIFDPTTHARLLPGTNDLTHYDTWQLWGPTGVGLDSDARRIEHVERVFTRQDALGVLPLAPTRTLDTSLGTQAVQALRTAQIARGLRADTWQSLAGRRNFWRGGADLDAYVGQLAALRAPCWLLTVVNDVVVDNVPDLADTQAFAGLLRTVHSLSQRSRVIICHSDYAGMPAIAAGADGVGTGWDRGMRFFDPTTFQATSPSIRIPASYVTQGGLAAVLRRDTADAIARLGEPFATRVRGGPMPADDGAERVHHLDQVRQLVDLVNGHGGARADRVAALRAHYEQSATDFDALLARLPKSIVNDNSKRRWVAEPYESLRTYALAEGLW